jgi:hypothetical protein
MSFEHTNTHMKTLSQLHAEKCRLARLLTRALENHNNMAVRANAERISALNRQIVRLEQSNQSTRT